MVRILDRNVKVWHLLVLGLLLGLLLGSTLTIAATPAATSGAGSVRFASARGTDANPVDLFGNDTERVLRATIKVPVGRVADVQTTFTGTIWPNDNEGTAGGTACFGYFTLDAESGVDARFPGGNQELLNGPLATLPSAVSVAMSGFSRGIGAGAHFINVYVASVDPGCSVADRELNVVVLLR
jgi:hypothetical protein